MATNSDIIARQLLDAPRDGVGWRMYLDAHREDYSSTDRAARAALVQILRPIYNGLHFQAAYDLIQPTSRSRWVCLMACAEHCPRRHRAFVQMHLEDGWAAPRMTSQDWIRQGVWSCYLTRQNRMSEVWNGNGPTPRPTVFIVGSQWLLRWHRDHVWHSFVIA